MARPQRSRGFTLVELLVVITIIGMLVSLLLPAIQAAREAGRRTTCLNNMRQVQIGLSSVEQTKKAFPGYVSIISKSPNVEYRASWVVQIMPAIEQSQLFQNWMNPALPLNWADLDNRSQYITQLGILQCPSNANPDLLDDATSYVVNTGIARTASDNYLEPGDPPLTTAPDWDEDSASGVCFNQSQRDFAAASRPGIKKVNIDYISTHDGSTNTILATENLQSGGWATDPNTVAVPFQTDFGVRASVGTVWFLTGQQDNAATPLPVSTDYNPGAMGLNDESQVLSGRPVSFYNDPMYVGRPTGIAYARPSANHAGGVNVMFCGGNGRFISEEIDYRIYTQLMTAFQNQVIVDTNGARANTVPSGATIQVPLSAGGSIGTKVPWKYILNEADF